MSKGKCVLAYSGGMDSTISVVWIKENYDLDVITLTVDLGAGPVSYTHLTLPTTPYV